MVKKFVKRGLREIRKFGLGTLNYVGEIEIS